MHNFTFFASCKTSAPTSIIWLTGAAEAKENMAKTPNSITKISIARLWEYVLRIDRLDDNWNDHFTKC